ncbi:MAG: biopolymer transporter ExbD [Gemmatimonadales bacterium]
MAGSVNTGGGGFTAEPNVVPMIDILLVLLIIFMMQVPLTRKTMQINVPPDVQNQQREERASSDQIVLVLAEDGSYAINGQPVTVAQLDVRFHEIYDNRPAKLLFIKIARNRLYQEIVEAMDIARGAGVQVIGFTPPESG